MQENLQKKPLALEKKKKLKSLLHECLTNLEKRKSLQKTLEKKLVENFLLMFK